MSHAQYRSPLAERYASKAMLELWSPQTRHGLWRRLWLALAEHERALGVDISAENVTATGFEIVFRTWADTRVARIRADWIAIGPAKDEDDWDVT